MSNVNVNKTAEEVKSLLERLSYIEADQKFQVHDADGNLLAEITESLANFPTSVKTGLNSLHLSEEHSNGSAGQNCVWVNNSSGFVWFPVWQGMNPDTGELIQPEMHDIGAIGTLDTAGVISAGAIDYNDTFTVGADSIFTKLNLQLEEDITDEELLLYVRRVGGNDIAKFKIFKTGLSGSMVEFKLKYPLWMKEGEQFETAITKSNGSYLQVTQSVEARPYREATYFPYALKKVDNKLVFDTEIEDLSLDSIFLSALRWNPQLIGDKPLKIQDDYHAFISGKVKLANFNIAGDWVVKVGFLTQSQRDWIKQYPNTQWHYNNDIPNFEDVPIVALHVGLNASNEATFEFANCYGKFKQGFDDPIRAQVVNENTGLNLPTLGTKPIDGHTQGFVDEQDYYPFIAIVASAQPVPPTVGIMTIESFKCVSLPKGSPELPKVLGYFDSFSPLVNVNSKFKGVYADATARNNAIPLNEREDGIYVIQEDTDTIWYYNNNDWVNTGASSVGDMLRSMYDPNSRNADVFERSNHQGTQAISTITGLQDELDSASKIRADAGGYNSDTASDTWNEICKVGNFSVEARYPDTENAVARVVNNTGGSAIAIYETNDEGTLVNNTSNVSNGNALVINPSSTAATGIKSFRAGFYTSPDVNTEAYTVEIYMRNTSSGIRIVCSLVGRH